jgi:hypothetical protein
MYTWMHLRGETRNWRPLPQREREREREVNHICQYRFRFLLVHNNQEENYEIKDILMYKH